MGKVMDKVSQRINPSVNRTAATTRNLSLAAVATGGLLFLMSQLIHAEFREPVEDPPPKIPEFVMETPEIEVIRDFVEPEPPTEPMPTTAPQPQERLPEPTTLTLPTEYKYRPPGNEAKIPINSDPIPIVKSSPRYPARALQKGMEGHVIVEFTITPNGSVADPRVLAGFDRAGNPTTLFNREALRAVKKFKYRPTMREGVPVARRGVQNRIVFKLQ